MPASGRELIEFVNQHGEYEVGVCESGHWWEEHHDGTCDACLDNAADQEDRHAHADHAFAFSDAATAESEYLTGKAFELGFRFENENPAGGLSEGSAIATSVGPPLVLEPDDLWFVTAALQTYQREGYVDVDVDLPEVSRGEAGAYVKAWLFIEYPACEAEIGIHVCVRRRGHDGPHACDSECDLGHLREDQLGEPTQ